MIAGLGTLIDTVQRNCDIADARHARDVTMCTYLLGMREHYRWEHELPFGASPPRQDVGRWISEREIGWAQLDEAEYAPLALGDESVAPFDAPRANVLLNRHGLVYGAGIGRFGKPHFFLGRLARAERRDGAQLLVCECEYARDISAIPAALQGETILVRRDALRQWLWQKVEGWAVKRQPGALARALAAHDYDADPHAALERLVESETETLILHETGELAAGRLLGPAWHERLAALRHRHAELLLRAVRDLLADCLVTLPALVGQRRDASLHLWFADFDGLRRELAPGLAAAYGQANYSGGGTAVDALQHAIAAGAAHWLHVARTLRDADDLALVALAQAPQSLTL